MKVGKVKIEFEKLEEDYPSMTRYLLEDVLPDNYDDVSFEVMEEDNSFYNVLEREVRVRITYKETSFTILMEDKYITYL